MSAEGDLRVWWIPQIPGEAFEVPVESIARGRWLMDVLAEYDQFQLDQRIKPDYANVGGIDRWESDGDGGYDWFSIDDDEFGATDGQTGRQP